MDRLFDPGPYQRPAPGTVYVGWNPTVRLVKIGYTTRPLPLRARELNLSSILRAFPGSLADESALHQRFAHARVGTSECFHLDPLLAAWLFEQEHEQAA